jgi:glycerophosphoryl diester phosphodiesterase
MMMLRNLLYLTVPALFTSCAKQLAAPLPQVEWDLFDSPNASPLPPDPQERMEGVYGVTEGNEVFGDQVVLKWSHTRIGGDTTYHVSIFGNENVVYLTGQGRKLDGSILLEMYWRTLVNTNTGPCWLTISPENGADLLNGSGEVTVNTVKIEGTYGDRNEMPDKRIVLHYKRPLTTDSTFYILAHRGGGRNSDQLPASENSVELIRLAPQLGANGVEIDVRLTSDGVPILYHDEDLNPRLVQDVGLHGPIKEFSYAQLEGVVRLVNGEKIPTLREALTAILNETDLRLVWLDLKFEGPLTSIRQLQDEFHDMAAAQGRDLRILIGLPDEEQVDRFKQLPNYQEVPSLCELDMNIVREVDAEVWAPMWVQGQQAPSVAEAQSEGRKAFVWTMDIPEFIEQYMNEGNYNGILSNYPSLLAYFHYVRQ